MKMVTVIFFRNAGKPLTFYTVCFESRSHMLNIVQPSILLLTYIDIYIPLISFIIVRLALTNSTLHCPRFETPLRLRFNPRLILFRSVKSKMALVKVFSGYYGFPWQFSFNQTIHLSHLSSEVETSTNLRSEYQETDSRAAISIKRYYRVRIAVRLPLDDSVSHCQNHVTRQCDLIS